MKKLTEEQKRGLLASEEVSTYLGGLCDAFNMSRAELRQAIDFLSEASDD